MALGSSNDSSTLLAGNVAGNAYPKIVLTDDGSGLAVWTDITPIDNTSFQSDIWWSVYNGTAWRTPQGMNTSSSCELNPILEIISDEDSNQSVVMTYLTIDDVVDVNDSVETFYENITIDTAIWTNTSGWSFSGGNISVSSGTVNTMEICDGGNNTVYMTYLVDSNVHPWENGNGSIYVVRGGINNSMVEWEDPVLVKYLGSSLNYSCQPGVSFPYSDAGGVVYSWWNKTSGMNETVLLATTSGFNDSNCTELIIRETHLSIKHVSSNIVNGSVVVCWVENRSSICSREILVNESDDPVNWTLGNITMVYSGLSISYVKPVYSDNKSFYLFQAGEGFTPFVIERLANGSWGHVRRISLARSYSLGHLDGDSNDVMSQMIYTCDIPVNSWQAGHWRFNEGDGNITADNSDFDNDGTIIGFSSVNSSVLWVKNNNISGNLSEDYGYCLRFINESGFVEVPYNSSLDVSDEFTLCSWIRLNSCSNGTRLVGRNGSWVVFEDNGSLGLKLWRENGTAVLSNITELPLDTWSFIAVRYDHGLVNVSMFPSGFDNVSEEYQLDDIDVNITNSSLIIGGFNGSVDETRLFNRDVTGSVIDSIWFAPYATLGSLHDIMVQQMPSFACFNFTTGRMDNGNITTEDVVEFTGSPSGFNFSWDFGDGTAAVGEVVTHQYNKPGFYIVVCNATDPSNGVVTPSVETLYVSDATVPVFNGLESAVASNCSVILVWDPALDNGSFVQYHVYMKEEGESFNYSNPCLIVSDTSCIISNLTANTTYYFVVRAKDSAGNMDDNTVEKSAIPFDAIPPVFEGLKLAYNISNVPGSVFLEWEAAVDMSPPVTYNVYMSNVTGGQNFSSPFNVTNITWYQLGGLENQLYYFVVRAEDTWSNEDNNTAEISVRPFIDVAAPEIMDVQAVPSAQGSGGWVNISCNVTDNARIDLVMVNITLPSSSYLNQTMTHILYTCTYYYNASYIIPGLYSYFIWANDTNGNANTSTVYNFTILDTESPTITDYTVGIGYTGDMFAFNATITDLGGVSTAWVEYWYGIGTHTNVSMNNVAGDYWEKTLVIDDTLDILHYIISANDTSNNWNNTGVKNVTIYDNDEPEITDVQADPLEQKIGGYVNISAVVTDNIEVDEVYLYIEYPDSSIENFSITQNRTGDMYHCNKTYHQLGVHTYHIWANDTSGNSNVSADYSFEIIPHGPDLCCDGALYWEDVVPGEVVEGEFEVWNCGDNFSELDWEITEWPDWGDDWSFDPASGEGLTPEAGHVTVTVEVKAPDVENEEFTGTIVICNSEDPGNCCEIEVTLITPYDLPFLQFLAQRFPILARILSLIL